MAETRFTQTMQLARGNPIGYVTARPISAILIVLVILSIVVPPPAKWFAKRNAQEESNGHT